MSNRALWTLVTVFALIKFALVGWWPFLFLIHQIHDTQIFLNQATHLLEGNWLGPYSEYTLMKGPATPIWIAVMNFLGIPLLTSHNLLYLGMCILLMTAFKRFTSNNGFALFVYVLALFGPFTFDYGAIASAFREMLHQPLVLGLIAVSMIVFADFVQSRRVQNGYLILFGVMFWLFWNNREEGIWIVPWLTWLLAVMAAYLAIERSSVNRWRSIRVLSRVVLVPVVIWGFGTLALAWKNYSEYGAFTVVELKTAQFQRAFGGLIGIEAETWRPYHAAQRDVLDKLYNLPSGSELNIDDKDSDSRKSIHSLMLPWTFRSAVANAGYYAQGGQSVLAFYDRIGREIEDACNTGEFNCAKPMFGLFPPWHENYPHRLKSAWWVILQLALDIEHHNTIHDYHSSGTPQDRLFVSRLVNSPTRSTEEEGDRSSPDFYYRLKKNKTKYGVKIVDIYRAFTPVLFWLSAAGLVLAVYTSVRNRKLDTLDAIYLGLAGTLFIQLTMFAVLRMTGYSSSIRLFYMFYPVLYTFFAVALLSMARNTRSLRDRRTDGNASSTH